VGLRAVHAQSGHKNRTIDAQTCVRGRLWTANQRISSALVTLLQDADLTIASLEPVRKREYQVERVLFLPGTNTACQRPRWKEQVRKQGVLALWKSPGFPSWCKPVGKDTFECTRG